MQYEVLLKVSIVSWAFNRPYQGLVSALVIGQELLGLAGWYHCPGGPEEIEVDDILPFVSTTSIYQLQRHTSGH